MTSLQQIFDRFALDMDFQPPTRLERLSKKTDKARKALDGDSTDEKRRLFHAALAAEACARLAKASNRKS